MRAGSRNAVAPVVNGSPPEVEPVTETDGAATDALIGALLLALLFAVSCGLIGLVVGCVRQHGKVGLLLARVLPGAAWMDRVACESWSWRGAADRARSPVPDADAGAVCDASTARNATRLDDGSDRSTQLSVLGRGSLDGACLRAGGPARRPPVGVERTTGDRLVTFTLYATCALPSGIWVCSRAGPASRRAARPSTPTLGASRASSWRCGPVVGSRRPACPSTSRGPGRVSGDDVALTRRGRLLANEVALRLR